MTARRYTVPALARDFVTLETVMLLVLPILISPVPLITPKKLMVPVLTIWESVRLLLAMIGKIPHLRNRR